MLVSLNKFRDPKWHYTSQIFSDQTWLTENRHRSDKVKQGFGWCKIGELAKSCRHSLGWRQQRLWLERPVDAKLVVYKWILRQGQEQWAVLRQDRERRRIVFNVEDGSRVASGRTCRKLKNVFFKNGILCSAICKFKLNESVIQMTHYIWIRKSFYYRQI